MKTWYKDAFGPLYTDLYGHRNADDARRAIDFVCRHSDLATAATGSVFDLCCGTGRHSLELLNRLPKASIIGMDLSKPLLAHAADGISKAGKSGLSLVRGDMRHLPFAEGSFNLVLNIFTSFGYFMDDAENEQAFHEVSRVLVPGNGLFLFDHINPAHLKTHIQPETRRTTSSGASVQETRSIDLQRKRVEKRIVWQLHGEKREFLESVRFYEPEEAVAMAEKAGMERIDAFGDFDNSILKPESPRAIQIFRSNPKK